MNPSPEPESAPRGPRRWRAGAATLFAVLLLNGVLSAENWWPTPLLRPDARLAPEFVLLWVVLLGLYRLRGRIGSAAIAWLSAGWILVSLARYLDVTAPALFGRPIKLYWDLPQLARFAWVWAKDSPAWQTALALMLCAVFTALVFGLARACVGRLARDLVPRAASSPVARLVTVAAVALVGANLAGVRATWPVVSKPVIPGWAQQLELVAISLSPAGLARALPASPRFGSDLRALGGADFKLFFLETYGQITFDDPLARQALTGSRDALEQAIRAGGRQVVSASVRSPTIGGGSDLAQLGLLAGVDLSDPRRHELLLTSSRPTLIRHFAAHGYQTFGLYPALSWEWTEGRFYGYDHLLDGPDLGWHGPEFGYWKLPDQFSIARFERMFPIDAGTPPRFLFFATINSHLPFAPVPPYQPDWARLLGPQPYEPAVAARALARKPHWRAMMPDYIASIDYTYQWLAGYLERPAPRPDLLVLIGDHQPTTSVAGPGISWNVPVHVITGNPVLVERFRRLGFAPGITPTGPVLGDMHQLTGWLLEAFDSREAG